jgi:tetratricopeptide (TPR) repeat protein
MGAFLLGVASSLAGNLLFEAARKSGSKVWLLLQSAPERKALETVFQSAFAHMLEQVAGHLENDLQRHVQGLFEDFLKRDSVATILVQAVIELDELPTRELEKTFDELGFDSGTLPISFSTAMQALLTGIADSLTQELRQPDCPLAAHVSQDRIKQILRFSKGIPRLLEGQATLLKGQDELLQNQKMLSQKFTEFAEAQEPRAGEVSVRLQRAKACLTKFEVTKAEIILEELRESHWSACPSEVKARVLGLLSKVEELKGNTNEAIELRGLAIDAVPDSREKVLQQGHLCRLLGDRQGLFDIAERLVEDAPNTPDAWSFWIPVAPEDITFDGIESLVPPTVRNDADVLFALSVRAGDCGRWEIAEEYARNALALAPDSPPAYINTALCLLQRFEGYLPGSLAADHVRKALEEAETMLRQGETLAGASPPKEMAILLRANRALVLRMLGRNGEAIEELAALQALQPERPQVVTDYARLLGNENRIRDAIRILKNFLENHASDMAAALLMELHLDDDPPDFEAALQVTERAIEHPVEHSLSRLMLLHNSIVVTRETNDSGRAIRFIEAARDLDQRDQKILNAEYERLWGEKSKAQELLSQVAEDLEPDAGRDLRRFVAILLERAGLHRRALDVWRSIVSTQFLSRDTYSFLQCAKRCESYSDILVTCRELRENGILALPLYEIELSILHEVNSFNEAITLTRSYLDEPFSEDEMKHLRFQLSTLGVFTGRRDLCKWDANSLPSVEKVSVDIGESMVKLLFETGKHDDAIRFAYELIRKFPDAVQSHRAIVAALFYKAPLDEYVHGIAEPGAAIEYETIDNGEKGWIILEDSGNAERSRFEFGPDDPLHKALAGKAIGDCFVLRSGRIKDTEARVLQVLSKFVYRLQKSMITLARQFGPDSGIEMVSLGSKDSESPDLSPLYDDLDRYEQEIKEISNHYNNMPVPLVVLAKMLGKNFLPTMASMHTELGLNIHCTTGLEKDSNGSLRQLRTAKALVLDLTAIGTVFVCDAFNLVVDEEVPICITEGAIRELRLELEYSKHLVGSAGNLGKIRGEYTFFPADREAMEQWCRRLEDAIHILESKADIVGGSVALEISQAAQAKFSQILPHYVIETLALAQRDGHVLWSDDGRLSALASAVCGEQPRVWTQLIARDRADSGKYPRESETKLSSTMLLLGYLHLTLDRHVIRHLMAEGNYDPTHHPVRVLLNQIDGMSTNPGAALGYSGMLLKTLWTYGLSDLQKSTLGDSILKKLRDLPQGGLFVHVLRDSLGTIFGIDVLNEQRCRGFMDAWLTSELL